MNPVIFTVFILTAIVLLVTLASHCQKQHERNIKLDNKSTMIHCIHCLLKEYDLEDDPVDSETRITFAIAKPEEE
jgi:hypothetical protein